MREKEIKGEHWEKRRAIVIEGKRLIEGERDKESGRQTMTGNETNREKEAMKNRISRRQEIKYINALLIEIV